MKAFWDLVITLATGLATWLAPLDVEPTLKPAAALGTVIGAGLMTAAYGLHGKDALTKRLGGRTQVVWFVVICTVCTGLYIAVRRSTLTESDLRFWVLAALLWTLSLILSALFSLVGMLAAEKLKP
ncbi:hypothetical protein [Variovorax sp. KK3]|uniref:hypothetical protein n=1 Tax=Variovorax sp. KK3 TaxID=1855728 RepID=UPI00097C921B|nr:hypothetical protein [Variovorax sp. KK3]